MAGEDWREREIDRGAALDREVDRLRGVYRDHAETLSKLAASSPSKQLARHYQELIAEINKAIVGLDEVGPDAIARKSVERATMVPESEKPTREKALPTIAGAPNAGRTKSAPAERPILSTYGASSPTAESEDGTLLRVILIVGLAIVLLGVLGLFVWKYSADRGAPAASGTPTETARLPGKEEPVVPALEPKPAPPSSLSVTPQQQDFGTVAKGTSAVRTFEIVNRGKKPVTLEIARSRCRCLWYDPPKTLPAGGRGTLSVRVDGAKAPVGLLAESIEISAKGAPDTVAVFEVNAEVK